MVSTRRAAAPTSHIPAVAICAIGAVTAIGAAFGPLPLVRVAVVVAVLTGVAALIIACRSFATERRDLRAQHGRELVDLARRERETLSRERTRHLSVLDALEQRHEDAIAHLQARIEESCRERDALSDRSESLQAQLAERDATIRALRDEDEADVLPLPRRGLVAAAASVVTRRRQA